jgi:hypothetical protein
MSLSLEPDEFDLNTPDRSHSNILDILLDDDDDHDNHRLHTLPVGGAASNLPSSSPYGHLAGIDEATTQRWEYEDKMAVLGLVLGSESNKPEANIQVAPDCLVI